MEKITKQLLKSSLSKTAWGAMVRGNTNPIARTTSIFSNQKEAKIIPALKAPLNKKTAQSVWICKSVTHLSTSNFRQTSFNRTFLTFLLNKILHSHSYEDKALREYESGHYHKAIQSYTKAILLRPNVPQLIYNRGLAKLRLGEFEAAIADFDMAIELANVLKSKLSQIEASHAEVVNNKDNTIIQKTLTLFESCQTRLFNNRSVAKIELGLYQEALADIDKTLALDPQFTTALYNRARANVGLRQFQMALNDLERFIELASHDTEGLKMVDQLKAWIFEQQSAEQNKPKNKPF